MSSHSALTTRLVVAALPFPEDVVEVAEGQVSQTLLPRQEPTRDLPHQSEVSVIAVEKVA